MLADKLDWNFDTALECEVAHITPELRIKAVRDESPTNPFRDYDGYWPMLVYFDGAITQYDKVGGAVPSQPLNRFSDYLLVFCQKELERILEVDANDGLDVACQRKWHTDVEMLRDLFVDTWRDGIGHSARLKTIEQLYALLGIPCLRAESYDYCQGDWAEVLVVATPEAQKTFGAPEPITPEQLQVDIYNAWAWGDVYGYSIERFVSLPDDDAEKFLGEIDDGSCWGYYGADHIESGLEEAALEALNHHLAHMKEHV